MAETSLSKALPQPVTAAVRPQVPFGAWGLRLTAMSYLLVLVAVPVFVVVYKGFEEGIAAFWDSVNKPVAYAVLKLTVRTSLIATLINTVMGTLTAYILVKYRFPGKWLFNLLIDMPFAMPTLVTGVMLVLLYGPQTKIGGYIEQNIDQVYSTIPFAGEYLREHIGHRILFAPPGIVLALLFVGYPFVIRTVQPVLAQLDVHQEEVAHTLGASPWRTFYQVILPILRPAVLTGALLSFARSLGEFGSIIIVAGNIPLQSQTATVYIYGRVESDDMQGASSISVVLLIIAFVITLGVDFLKGKRHA